MDKLLLHIQNLEKWLKFLNTYIDEIKKYYSLPLKEKYIEDLDNDKRLRELIDLIIYNFSKIQSLLGEKVFKEVADIMLIEYNDFIDLLAKLEQNGILTIGEWKKLRVIRNNFSHEYPEEIIEITQNLNDAIENVELLKTIVRKIKNKMIQNAG